MRPRTRRGSRRLSGTKKRLRLNAGSRSKPQVRKNAHARSRWRRSARPNETAATRRGKRGENNQAVIRRELSIRDGAIFCAAKRFVSFLQSNVIVLFALVGSRGGMSNFSAVSKATPGTGWTRLRTKSMWRVIAPLAVTVILALAPAPPGLAQHAWYYFAIFAGVIVALISEPLPGGAIGLIGVTVVTLLAPFVLYGPAELAKPGFNAADAALTWALAGFANGTVWLIFAAFLFALAYEKTGLGKRIAL